MKKGLAIVIIIATIITVLSSTAIASHAKTRVSFYPNTFVVVEVDYKKDIVTCVDFNGGEWSFDGAEDWFVGDMVSAIMSDNGTEDFIYDDDFIQVRYVGWINGSWGFDIDSEREIVSIKK